MIDEATLMSFSHFFQDDRQLEKDYLLNLMLKTVSVNKISNYLEFKGGTALYMFNGLDRFSEDLDFTYIGKDALAKEMADALITPVIKDFSLSYNVAKNRGNIIVKDERGNVSGTRTEIFIEGPLFIRTGTRHKIKIDISTRNDTIMKPEHANLVSKYNDIGTMLVYKMPTEEILTEKLCAIAERSKARDLYDVYFLLRYKSASFDEKMLDEKFDRRKEPLDKKAVIDAVHGTDESSWKEELYYLIKELPELTTVKSFVIDKIK